MLAVGKVLITGADGFIGRALAAHLAADGHSIRCVVRAGRSCDAVEVGDIANFSDWPALLEDIDAVVHLAGRAHVLRETSVDSLAESRRVNVDATLRLSRAAAAAGVRRFIFLSTIGVNGNSTAGRAFSESDEPNPTEPYAISKWEAESGLIELGLRTRMQITRVRAPLVIGAGVKGNLRRLIRLVDSHLPLPFGAIRNHRSFVALEDLCELLTKCVTHECAADELFLAADPQEISTPDLMRGVAEGLGTRVCLVPVPLTALLLAGQVIGAKEELRRMSSSLSVNAARAHTMLGWQIRVGLRTGIRQMAESYLHEGRSESRSAEFKERR
jgi:nucleoside-diphosphate-sugar epimerase